MATDVWVLCDLSTITNSGVCDCVERLGTAQSRAFTLINLENLEQWFSNFSVLGPNFAENNLL